MHHKDPAAANRRLLGVAKRGRNGKKTAMHHPANYDKEYDNDEIEFLKAMEDFKLRSGKKFPMWSEVLAVLKSIGYKKG